MYFWRNYYYSYSIIIMKYNTILKLLSILLLLIFFKVDAQVPTNGLVAWYPMNGNAGDSSASANHGALYGSVANTANRFNMPSKALAFNGSNTYMEVPAASAFNTAAMNNVLISTWFKVTTGTANTTDRMIFMYQDASNRNYSLVYTASTGKIRFINYNGPSATTVISIISSINITLNSWYHLALRIDSVNNTQMFINNQLVASSTTTVVKPVNPFISIGRHPIVTGTWNFLGAIDDVHLYNRYLTNAEIASLYSDGINDLVAWYPMNGNAGDSSGYNNHGTVYGGMTSSTGRTGQANTAYYFDGINDYIQVPRSFSIEPSNQLSLTAWIAPEYLPAGWRMILTKRWATSTDPYNSYSLATSQVSPFNNRWGVAVSNGTASSGVDVYAHNSYPASQWLFLTATLTNNTLKLYVNGVLDSTRTFTGNIGYSNMDLYIGWGTSGANEYYKGKMDEIRIYSRALSASEIQSLYASGTTYYSKSSGNLNVLSTWGTNPDGSGTSPLSFDSSNTNYRVLNNSAPVIGGNWTVNGANTMIVFGDGTNSFNLSIPSGTAITCDSAVINSNITITVQGAINSTKMYGADNSTLQYFGSAVQNMAGGSFYNIICTSTNKILTANTTARNALTITTSINCNNFVLSLGSGPTQLGTLTRSSGTIIGKFQRWFAASTTSSPVLFPVGTTSYYRPLAIDQTSAPTVAGTVTGEFISGNPGGSGLPYYDATIASDPVYIDKVGVDGVWRATQGNGLSGGAFTVTLTPASFYGVNDYSKLRIVKRAISGSWTIAGNAISPTGSNAIPVIARTGQSGSSEFGIGSDQSQNPMPVTWLYFNASMINAHEIKISWSTSSEINTSYFEIERSLNNDDWAVIAKIKAAGNSVNKIDYLFHDRNFSPDFKQYYYRIKQVDLDEKFEYSKTVLLNNDRVKTDPFIIYPNPASNTLQIVGSNTDQISVFSVDGKIMYKGFDATIDVRTWPRGLYIIRIANACQKISLE